LVGQRRYGWLRIIFLVWANLHGAVVIGAVVVVAALVAAMVEDRSAARRLAPWTVAAAAATLCTPMGIHFWIAIVRSLGRIRLLGIDEWAPPRLGDAAMLPFWLAAATLIALVSGRGRQTLAAAAARRNGPLPVCLCALALLLPAIRAVRNVPPFLLIAVQAIAVLARIAPDERDEPTASTRANLAIATAAVLASLAVVAVSYARRTAHLNWEPLPARS